MIYTWGNSKIPTIYKSFTGYILLGTEHDVVIAIVVTQLKVTL